MPGADFLDLGNWNAHCAKCGFKFKASDLIKEGSGAGLSSQYVCRKCWRPKQPQDLVRGIPDKPAAPWVQRFPEVYNTDFCDIYGISCLADWAVADCSICDYLPSGLDITESDLALALDEDEDTTILTDDTLLEIIP